MALITFMALCVPLFCVDAAITLAQKPCGAKLCHFMEYCSSFNNRCESCEIVCNSTSHNYDQVACTDQCQGTNIYSNKLKIEIQLEYFTPFDLFRLSARNTICERKQFLR